MNNIIPFKFDKNGIPSKNKEKKMGFSKIQLASQIINTVIFFNTYINNQLILFQKEKEKENQSGDILSEI